VQQALRRLTTPLPGVFGQAFFEKGCDKTFFEKVFGQAFFEKVCGLRKSSKSACNIFYNFLVTCEDM
jgi:hypothetical protein